MNRFWKTPVRRICAITASLGLVMVLLSGCPDTDIGDTPPFDTTGNYAGTYATNAKQFGGAEDCTFELELVQFVDQPLIAYTFAGIARLDWDCILPPLVRTSLGIESEVLTAPVLATLDNDGGFALEVDLDGSNIPPALLAALDDSGVDTDIPLQSFALTFTGTGEDTDDDGLMDACSGTLDVSATYVDESGTQTIDLGGNFDVTRASGS